jgi:hypothetical protein
MNNGQPLFTPEEEAAKRKELNIPPGAKVTFGKLVKTLPRPTTYGWSDDQIARVPMDTLQNMHAEELAAEKALRKSLKDQQKRRKGFAAIIARKKEVG